MSALGNEVNRILSAIKSGKTAYIQKLHEITFNHLTVVAYNYIANPSDIEDVLNETYFHVIRYINSFDESKDGYNWLCKIVQNIAYTYNKKHKVLNPVNRIRTNEFSYEMEETLVSNNVLLNILKRFDREAQQLIYLKFWEDLSYRELAVTLDMKKSTVYKKMKSILKIIKKEIED